MDTQTQIDRLIELAIVQRAELKALVEQLPQLREYLGTEIEKTFEQVEPQLRGELEEFCNKRTEEFVEALRGDVSEQVGEILKTLETAAAAKYSALMAERERNAELEKKAEDKIAEAAAALPSQVKEIVTAELARFPRAGEIDQLRKEFAEPRGLNPRGKWIAGETYNKLDLVTFNGDSFVSNIDGNTEKPSRSAANWTLNAARGISGGGGGITSLNDILGNPSTGDIVGSEGNNYVRKTLTAGDGIGITETSTTITIDASAAQQKLTATVKNAESFAITRGQVVYLFGATGNIASVKLASNTSDATSAKTFGVVSDASIAANGTGIITCVGVQDKLTLGAYNEGDTLYLGATAGSVTNVKPYAPNHLVYVGIVERANNGNGELYVKIQNGYELDEIHDVQINDPRQAGQTLIYDATNSLWKNARLTAGVGVSITNADSSITISADGGVNYQGTWNASTNTPTLTSSVGTKGFYYVVSVAGSTNLNGVTDWKVGDWAIFNGTAWEKVDTTDQVSSVFGRTGAVVGVSTDYSSVGITNTAIGASNPSTGAFTTLSATGNLTVSGTGTVTGDVTITRASSAGGVGVRNVNTDSSGYASLSLNNSGGTAQSFDIGTGGSAVAITALRQKLYIYDSTAGTTVMRLSGGSTSAVEFLGTGTHSFAGALTVSSSTASTSTTTGALVVTGGVGVGGAINAGGNLTVSGSGTVNSPSGTSSGLLVKAFNTAGGNVQQWADFQTSTGLTLARFLRGNGVSGYDANGLSIDSYSGLWVNLNALGGSGGTFTIAGGNLTVSGTTMTLSGSTFGIDMGAKGSANNPFFDFNSSGNNNDFDVRLQAKGGGVGSALGTLTLHATTAATASNAGAFVIGDSGTGTPTAGTAVAIGSGKIFTGSDVSVGGNLTVSGAVRAGAIPTVGTEIGDFYQATAGSNAFRAVHVNGNAIRLNPSYNYYDSYDHIFRSLSGTTTYATIKNNGNLLIGTTTDSANGKLQLATHTTSAGGIGFGSDVSLYRGASGIGTLELSASSGTVSIFKVALAGTAKAQFGIAAGATYIDYDGSLIVRNGIGGTTALTLDSSQNATFAGYVTVDTTSGAAYRVKKSNNASGSQSWLSYLDVSGTWAFQCANDNFVGGNTAFTFTRSGLTPTGMTINATTDSSSTTTGALTVAGGVGIAKNLYVANTATAYRFQLSSGGPWGIYSLTRNAFNQLQFNGGSSGYVFNDDANSINLLTLGNTGNATFAGSVTTAAPTSGTAKAWKLGEVATVSPTSPNRTIRVEIDGTVYYISAKTTND